MKTGKHVTILFKKKRKSGASQTQCNVCMRNVS